MGVSAIILAVLLANIPFPSEAEDDPSVSGGDSGGTTSNTGESESEEITYELSIVDERSRLSGTSSVTLENGPDVLKKNITVRISGQDSDATGVLETSGRYTYQTISVSVEDTDTGDPITNFGTCTAWIALTQKMDLGGGVLKVYPVNATSSTDTDSAVELKDSSTADYLKVQFTSAPYERVLQYYVYYVNSNNTNNTVDTLGFYQEVSGTSVLPTFVGAKMTKDWELRFSAIQSEAASKLLPLLEADPSITYDDIELTDIALYYVNATGNSNDMVPGSAFTSCTIRLQAPPRMPLSSGNIKMYSVKNNKLDPLPTSKVSGQYFEFTTTHFTEFALLYTKDPNAGGGGSTSGGGSTGGGSSEDRSHDDDDDDDRPVTVTTVATETETAATETETETVSVETVPIVISDTGTGTGNTQITMNSGNKGAGRKSGSVDMPKTGDADTYRYVGVLMLLFFGIFELISSIPAGRRRTAGR